MLTLSGILDQCLTTGGHRNGKGELIPIRHVLQIKAQDGNGRYRYVDLYVDDLEPWRAKEGSPVSVPVRAWATGAQVQFQFVGGARS